MTTATTLTPRCPALVDAATLDVIDRHQAVTA